MYPARTMYYVAQTPQEYKTLHAFFREEAEHPQAYDDGFPAYEKFTVSWPTVYGVRDGHPIGVMGSQFHPQYGLVASPLHVAYDLKNHMPTVLRLVDCYEHILVTAGVWEYLILIPNWKPSGEHLFGDLKHGERLGTLASLRLDLYRIQIGA
jgi:hypothetical protein